LVRWNRWIQKRDGESNYGDYGEIQGVAMFEELYKFISRLHYGIKFMPEKDFDELLSRCEWEQKIYALYFRYW
jgi:hypothetical protein